MRSTARTGKLKRSKARKPSDAAGVRAGRAAEEAVDPRTRKASVGELIAALDGGLRGESPAPEEAEAPHEEEDEGEGEVRADGPSALADADVAPASRSDADDGDDDALRRARWAHADPDDLGLAGYEDDDSEDEPPPAEVAAPVSEPRPDGVELSDTLPMAPEDDLSRVKGQASPRLMSVIESLLFASDKPLTVRDIRRVLKEPTVRQVQLALKQLMIDTTERGVVLSQVAGGFRLRTNPNNAQWVQRMLAGKPTRLSRSQLEALAVIAYRQPITKPEIDHVRGVDCGAVLRMLLERNLVRIVGRKEEPGRPHLYGTTVEFLEFFNLRSLRDMPDLHEFRELTDESRATVRAEFGEEVDELEAEVLGQEVLHFDAPEGGQAPGPSEDGAASSEAAEGDAAEATAAGDEPSREAAESSAAPDEPEAPETADASEATDEDGASEDPDASNEEDASNEADEGSDEADEGSDEADEGSDEADEGSDEADASAEGEGSEAADAEPEGSDEPADPEEAAS